jgi:hypothetical protein
MTQILELKLSPEQIDTILGALGDQPYIKVSELIQTIREQAVPQWQALNAPPQTEEDPQP